MSLHSFPDPHNTAASSPAEAGAGAHPVLTKLCVCVSLCACLVVRVYTLTNTAFGFTVEDITNITQAIVAALLILTLCCSTHTWVLTLIHIWKTQNVLNCIGAKNSINTRSSAGGTWSEVVSCTFAHLCQGEKVSEKDTRCLIWINLRCRKWKPSANRH